jgi:hypothetical protein
MGVRYDDKGKFFTQVITKDAIPVVIQTLTHRIEGNVHVRKDERLSDELNRSEQFMAVTDASIYDLGGQQVSSSKFIAVNRDHIVWLRPVEERRHDQGEGES